MTKTTYRNVKKEKFTPISNSLLWDKELSLQAKGLLAIFLSNTLGWKLNIKEISTRSKNGRDAHYKIVNELIELGYFSRIRVIDFVTKTFEEMIYIFSDIKQEVADELENIKQRSATNGKDLIIEYKTKKDKTMKENENEPYPENQDTVFQNPDVEGRGNQDINNINQNNIIKNNNINNNTNLNLNLNLVNNYDVLSNAQIPNDLKIKIKAMIVSNKISLSVEDFLHIQDAYHYQIQREYVIPHCSCDDPIALNEYEFTSTVIKMLETVKDIENMRGLIKDWVEKGYYYKKDRLHISDYSSTGSINNNLLSNWLSK
ncbi:hypothetical protein P9D43_20925 [Neobacillus niacini]|uniref:hypothetical protein n=1 Tax=Neobacillus niacini TaxID=86668 RepID=UPI0007AB792E|nr:hypothetical protein [Neobacillus niacini]MEC1524470.1 hypothetical protein [Neobacillus niacini]